MKEKESDPTQVEGEGKVQIQLSVPELPILYSQDEIQYEKSTSEISHERKEEHKLENVSININGFTTPDNHENQCDKTLPQNNGDARSDKQVKATTERNKRAEWGNGIEFLMSCIAMSVGLGNIWRFPFVAYENGGGAFLIPYLIVLVLVGRPVYYLEMCLGQFTNRGNVKMFQALAPALKGIGYGQLLGSLCVATYYCSLVAITLFYFINSFTSELPWTYCRNEWEVENNRTNSTCIASNSTASTEGNSVSSTELYFRLEVIKEKIQIDDGIGYPEWRLTLCLLFSWLIIFIITRKGVQSSGKASYFLAIFPYVIMITLLVRACTLNGSATGMMYFINPDWNKLLEAKVWYAAVTQCFFSLNVGFGTITMYASYNDFKHNVYRDAIIVTTLDTFTSLLSGTTIFGILGSLAFKMNVDVNEVINSGGTGLAFISYPEAIGKFDSAQWVFALLFFFMLFVLGIGSLVALHGVTVTVIMDSIPFLKIWHVSLGASLFGFLIGLVYITPGGQYIFTLVDYFGGTMIFLILTIFETTMVFWWYGLENFIEDVEYMLKRKTGIYWRFSWGLITPVILIGIFIYFIFTMEDLQYEGKDFPRIALVCGWLIVAFGVFQIPLWWTYYIHHKRKSGLKEALRLSLSHSGWGPSNLETLEEWRTEKLEKELIKSKSNLSWLKKKCYILIGKEY